MKMLIRCAAVCSALLLATGCSIKRVAINKLGNALASGGSTFTSDDDPELVEAAIPFGLKLYESLLDESPKHRGLLLAACSGFTEYAYAFVDARVDEAKDESLERADALRVRARKLYLRANRYGMRGLEARYPGFGAALDRDAATALKRTDKRDVALLYWTAASRGLAISLSKDNPDLIAELPLVEMIVRRVGELEENFNNGAVPEFLITLEAAHRGEQSEAELQKILRALLTAAGGDGRAPRGRTGRELQQRGGPGIPDHSGGGPPRRKVRRGTAKDLAGPLNCRWWRRSCAAWANWKRTSTTGRS